MKNGPERTAILRRQNAIRDELGLPRFSAILDYGSPEQEREHFESVVLPTYLSGDKWQRKRCNKWCRLDLQMAEAKQAVYLSQGLDTKARQLQERIDKASRILAEGSK